MDTATQIKLGQAVEYFSTEGKPKLAFVLGTQATTAADDRIPELSEGQAHLVVFSLTGKAYNRYNVPEASYVADNAGFTTDSGAPAGVWRVIE